MVVRRIGSAKTEMCLVEHILASILLIPGSHCHCLERK